MLPIIFKNTRFKRFVLLSSVGLLVTACSSLNQKAYDVDGIYNNSKIVVEDTHEKGNYYSEYFKEKAEESQDYFTDVDGYSSGYNQGNPGWGDVSSSSQIVYDWGYGYGSPYMYGSSFWGFGYGWNSYWGGPFYGGFGWGYPYYGYGWGAPYYGLGWGYPYYNYRTISRSNSYRSLNNRSLTMANRSNNLQTANRSLTRTSNFNKSTFKADRTFARTATTSNRMQIIDKNATNRIESTRLNNSNNNTNRLQNNSSNNRNRTIERTSTRPTFNSSTPSRLNSGGSFGGSRSFGGSTGGMRSSGGGRR